MKLNAVNVLVWSLAILSSTLSATSGFARTNGNLRAVRYSQASQQAPVRSTASASGAAVQSFQFRLVVENQWSQFRLQRQQGTWNLSYVSNFEKTRTLQLKPQQAETLLSQAGRTLASDESISRCSDSYLQLEVNPTSSAPSRSVSYGCWNSNSEKGKQVNGLFDSLALTLKNGKPTGRI